MWGAHDHRVVAMGARARETELAQTTPLAGRDGWNEVKAGPAGRICHHQADTGHKCGEGQARTHSGDGGETAIGEDRQAGGFDG